MFRLLKIVGLFTAILVTAQPVYAVTIEDGGAVSDATPPLTIKEALSEALQNSPYLRATSLEVTAMEASIAQAKVFPNPELSAESENFASSGGKSSDVYQEQTITISQRIETAGKRGDRIRIAKNGVSVAEFDRQLTEHRLASEVVTRFVATFANQLRLLNAGEILSLTRNLSAVATARVEAGKEAPFQKMNAMALLFAADADFKRAKNELILSRHRLSLTWGESEPKFRRVIGQIESITPPPAPDEILDNLDSSPQSQANSLISKSAQLDVERQAGNRWPDVTLSLGDRRLRYTNDRAIVGGLSVAIPIFNRNQGSYRAAQIRLEKAKEAERNANLDHRLEVESLLSDLWTAYHELESFRQAGLKAGQQAMQAAIEGYREGKLRYVEALDAQRVHANIQARYIDVLEKYHTLRTKLNQLTGRPAEEAGIWLSQENKK